MCPSSCGVVTSGGWGPESNVSTQQTRTEYHFTGFCSPSGTAFHGAHHMPLCLWPLVEAGCGAVTGSWWGRSSCLLRWNLLQLEPTLPKKPCLRLSSTQSTFLPRPTHSPRPLNRDGCLVGLFVFVRKVLSYNLKETKRTSYPPRTRTSTHHHPAECLQCPHRRYPWGQGLVSSRSQLH